MSSTTRVTQRDIAKMAGVSQATVSLVLNNSKSAIGRIPEETRARVQKAIRETGYVADPIARRMAKGLNRILGVFTYEPAFADPDFFSPFLLGVEEGAQALGYDLLLLTGAAGSGGHRQIFHENNRLRLADGCIIIGREFDREELRQLVSGDYPFVALGRCEPVGDDSVPYVGADYLTASAELVRRAKARGHQRLAYIGPSTGPEWAVDRWLGFSSELWDVRLETHVDAAGEPALPVLDEILDSGATVAFFADHDEAVAVEAAARAQNLSVPGHFSIVVLGSHLRPAGGGPNFTTFAIPREDMARRAATMLADRIETGSKGRQILLSCEQVEGETLGFSLSGLTSR